MKNFFIIILMNVYFKRTNKHQPQLMKRKKSVFASFTTDEMTLNFNLLQLKLIIINENKERRSERNVYEW